LSATEEKTNGQIDGETDGCTERHINRDTDGWRVGLTDIHKDMHPCRQTDGLINRQKVRQS
jgi:hypothetical protein